MSASLVALRAPTRAAVARAVERHWDAGDAILPLPVAAPEPVVDELLAALRPDVLAEHDARGNRTALTPLTDPLPTAADVALVVATSGTTGSPKGVELTRAALDASTAASVDRLGCRAGDRWLCCLPLHHVAGLGVLRRAWVCGTRPVVHERFDVGDVAAADVEWLSLVPTQLVRLLDAGADLTRLRGVLLGGATVPASLVARAQRASVRVVTSYGLTETSGGCVYDGRPLDGVEVALDPDGTIRVAGPVLMAGYRGQPELTAAALRDGWLATADRGRWTDDGRLAVLGRGDDVIVTGGENVAAEVVAEVLRSHPQVADAAVTGRADDEWGEIVVAVVVPRSATAPPAADDLRAHVRARLPAAAAPREIVLAPAIPRDDLGKLRRSELTELAGSR